MISYTRARANRDPKVHVGFRERPERVVLIILARGGVDPRRRRSHGGSVVGDRGLDERDRDPPHDLYVPAGEIAGGRAVAFDA